MEFFNQFTIAPDAQHLLLLRYLLVITLLIHVPYMAMAVGGTSVSLVLNLLDRDRKVKTTPMLGRLAYDLMHITVPNRLAPLLFGVLPLGALWMIYGQWLYQSSVNTMDLFPVGVLLIAVGFLATLAYRGTMYPGGQNRAVNLALGKAAVGMLIVGTYIVIGSVVRFQDPERWHLTHDPIRTLTSFNIIWKYLFFLMSGFAMAGCSILYFFFNWSGRKPVMDPAYMKIAKNVGAALAMKGVLLLPVFGFFYMVTTPILAMSTEVYSVAIAVLIVLFIIFVLLYLVLASPTPRFGRLTFILLIVVFLLTGVWDQMTLVNATKEHSAMLVTQAEAREAEFRLEREKLGATALKIDLALGENVFNTVCSTCHKMDERVVGPPLNSVLPKYAGKYDELVSYIQSPSKKDPAYPPMPAPAVNLSEIKSVAAFLLGEDPAKLPGGGDGH